MSRPDPSIWTDILAHLRQHHAARCRQWFENLEVVDLGQGVLTISVPQPFHRSYLERDCREMFNDAAQTVTGRLVAVRFIAADGVVATPNGAGRASHAAAPSMNDGHHAASAAREAEDEPGAATTATARRDGGNVIRARAGDPAPVSFSQPPYDDMVLNPDYTFENFVVGPNNRLAHAAAIAVARQPAEAYNPFFIHGGVGLGKTHLLQAICQCLLEADPGTRIYYVSCESFTNQFIEAVQAGQMNDFRHRFRDIDILMVDDIHFLAGHDRTQEEFFHTFNTLFQNRKQIVLSSDAAPEEIPTLEDRLLSRFKSGLVAAIDKPGYETRLTILRNKSEMRGLKADDEVLCYIAHRIDSNIRELEGALTQLQGLSMATSRAIDLELAKEALGDQDAGARPAVVTIQNIIGAVSQQYDIKPSELLSKRRHKSIAHPRQVAMYLAREHTNHSLQEVGAYFGGRDHTTVLHAVSKIKTKRGEDESLDRVIKAIESVLNS
ncbi:MAG: chromosomal replication initiator protein DnaA [Phycisphaerales bacterium]